MSGEVIIVSGFAGSGKSTLAEKIAEHFELRCIHASSLLRELKSKTTDELNIGHTEAGTGWWESKEGGEFLRKRMENGSIDRKLDEILLEEIKKGEVVIDSWTMPWLSKRGYKIWLNASLENRAKRVAERDNLPFEEVKEKIAERDKDTTAIYEKLYGFKMGADIKPFDFVLDTDDIDEEEVFKIVKEKLQEYFSK